MDYCHPNLRKSTECTPAADTSNGNCSKNSKPCNTCCLCYEKQRSRQKCPDSCPYRQQQCCWTPDVGCGENTQHIHSVPVNCTLGADFKHCSGLEKGFLRASGGCCCSKDCRQCSCHRDIQEREEVDEKVPRPCCEEKIPNTEFRMCRCDPLDPSSSKRCECECGATVREPEEIKPKKSVRFAEEVRYVDCDKAFQNLDPKDIKHLCQCCKGCVNVGKDVCVGKPVMVYELPEPKFEDTSVTHGDFLKHKTPRVEVPPWHPNIKDRWRYLDVPSLSETTYQCDYKPPPVVKSEEGRCPVYLAPQREERDPCQKLAEEYCAWKKTSVGPPHVYHSSCDCCDKDLHRLHLHECDASHLPPPYQCHGDGHLCDRVPATPAPAFAICEMREDPEKSRYWWQRTCCKPDKADITRLEGIPADQGECLHPYTTMYQHDYRHPKRVDREERREDYCADCEYCSKLPNLEISVPASLCTKNPHQPFITQCGGMVGT